jgi:trehalose utilization protein
LFAPLVLLASAALCDAADKRPIRVLVWDEQQPEQKKAYGDTFLGGTIAAHLSKSEDFKVTSVSLTSPGQGLDAKTLDETDVLIWWGHVKHKDVKPENVEAVAKRVLDGKLRLIALHSAHWSQPFMRLMDERAKLDAPKMIPKAEREGAKLDLEKLLPRPGVKRDGPLSPAVLKEGDVWRLVLPACVFPAWRADGLPSHVKTLLPDHPVAKGLPEKWDIPHTEMYDEPFHVPVPDAVVFEEHWDKGEHFRSGCVWKVGKGAVFYFRPGHETFAVYRQAEPLRVIENAARWLARE